VYFNLIISSITYLADIYCFLIDCHNVISSSKSEEMEIVHLHSLTIDLLLSYDTID